MFILCILSIVSTYSIDGASRITNSLLLKQFFPERFLATKTQQHLPVSGGAFFFCSRLFIGGLGNDSPKGGNKVREGFPPQNTIV